MNYREWLKKPTSIKFIDKLVANVNDKPEDFEKVYRLVFDDDVAVAWKAAWACQKISEKQPGWFSEESFMELADLVVDRQHGGLLRGCLSVLCHLALPQSVPVGLINVCFERMIDPKVPVAVQALSMKMLFRICQKEPDFIPELKAYLENMDCECYSPGFRSTRKNILKAMVVR